MSAQFFQKRCLSNYGLNHFSHLVGWIGIVLRFSALIIVIILLAKLSQDDSKIYKIVYGLLLAYFLITLIPNGCFIFGIFKLLRHFMLVYIVLLAFELSLCFIVLLGVSVVLIGIGVTSYGLLLSFLALIFIGGHYGLWLCSVLFYKQMEMEIEVAEEEIEEPSIHLTRFYLSSNGDSV